MALPVGTSTIALSRFWQWGFPSAPLQVFAHFVQLLGQQDLPNVIHESGVLLSCCRP